ncbi:MAG: hypothetical protein JWN76_1419 [Chitinophagaceae bacterium]|nr:hypothetical protein [Chitinophagaceae bacterium]
MAASFFRRLTRRFFIIITVLLSVAFILSCLVAYLNPATWWVIGFLGLTLPYLIIVLVFSLIFWLIFKPKYSLIPLLALIIGIQQIRVLFAFHWQSSFDYAKQNNDLRIVTWNVRNFVPLNNNSLKEKYTREGVANSLFRTDADVICLQEFNNSTTRPEADNIGLFSKKYPYHFYSRDQEKKAGYYEYGSIIFSRFPIIASQRIPYEGINPESLIFIDIVKGADTVRIFTTHLQSFKFSGNDYQGMEKIKDQDEEAMQASKSIIKKMRFAFTRRGMQATRVRNALDNSPYPTIICGDFNDVPNSYTYFKIKGDYKDAFLLKNFGIGRTYNALAPTLRIDYILADPRFMVKQFDMVDEDLSDHIMLVSDVYLQK